MRSFISPIVQFIPDAPGSDSTVCASDAGNVARRLLDWRVGRMMSIEISDVSWLERDTELEMTV